MRALNGDELASRVTALLQVVGVDEPRPIVIGARQHFPEQRLAVCADVREPAIAGPVLAEELLEPILRCRHAPHSRRKALGRHPGIRQCPAPRHQEARCTSNW